MQITVETRDLVRAGLHTVKWSLIGAALVLFGCEGFSLINDPFGTWWAGSKLGRAGVALASLAAFVVTLIHDEIDESDKIKESAEKLAALPARQVPARKRVRK